MNAPARALALSLTTALTSALLLTPAPAAASSCVAQSVQVEHELYGTAWGRDVIASLASQPQVLAELGFDKFGDLASYAARQDQRHCPAGL